MLNYTQLREYLKMDSWVSAINYLYEEEKKHPNDVSIAINIVYCNGIMLVEQDLLKLLYDEYVNKSIEHFSRALTLFSDDPDFLFYSGWMACIGEWCFGVDQDFLEHMIDKAYRINPESFIYSWALCQRGPHQMSEKYSIDLAKYISLNGDGFIKKYGPFGDYFLECFLK